MRAKNIQSIFFSCTSNYCFLFFYFKESQPSFMHTNSSVSVTDFLFLSYPSIVGPCVITSSFLACDIVLHQRHWLTHALVWLKLAMTSSGCSLLQFSLWQSWVVDLYDIITSTCLSVMHHRAYLFGLICPFCLERE